MALRDRLLDGALDLATGLMTALTWLVVGVFAVPFAWGIVVIVRAVLGLMF